MIALILDGGVPAVTMRGIARRMNMNPGIVNQWFGSREAMLVEVGRVFGGRWYRWVAATTRAEGAAGLLPPLPSTPRPGSGITAHLGDVDPHLDAMAGMRAWLALHELGRSEPALAAALAELSTDERQVVSMAARSDHARPGTTWLEEDVDLVLATAAGLRHAIATGPDPMPLGRARDRMALQVALVQAAQTRRSQSDEGGLGSSASGV